MALKTNTKKAINNLWQYLEGFIDAINDEYIAYNPEFNYLQPGDKKALATVINAIFEAEKLNNDNLYKAGRISRQDLFTEWAQGLPCCGIFDFWYYNASAIEILGDILEESEDERAAFTEDDAGEKLTYLIYREVEKNRR